MISVVAKSYGIHPQTLRLYEREGLLKPSRTEGNTRLYSEDDLRQLEVILNLTRDLGVNLAGVEIVLNMRRKMEQMQGEIGEFLRQLKEELLRTSREGWEEKLEQALVRIPPSPLVRTVTRQGLKATYNLSVPLRMPRRKATMPAPKKKKAAAPKTSRSAKPSARAGDARAGATA